MSMKREEKPPGLRAGAMGKMRDIVEGGEETMRHHVRNRFRPVRIRRRHGIRRRTVRCGEV